MSEESIENVTKWDSNYAPTFVDHHLLSDIYHYYQTFNGHCWINDNISIPEKVINLYVSYALPPWLKILNTYFTFGNCLCGSVTLTKNVDLDKYKSI